MKIVKKRELDTEDYAVIEALQAQYEAAHGYRQPQFTEAEDNAFMVNAYAFAYSGDEAVGFMSAFIPGDGTAELYAALPGRVGDLEVLRELLKSFEEELKGVGVVTPLLVMRAGDAQGMAQAPDESFELFESQYLMEYERLTDFEGEGRLKGFNCEGEEELYIYRDGEVKQIGGVVITVQQERGFISDVYVDADARGRGYGKVVLEAALLRLKQSGAGSVMLHVEGSNIPAVRLYESFGFIKKDRLDFFEYIW